MVWKCPSFFFIKLNKNPPIVLLVLIQQLDGWKWKMKKNPNYGWKVFQMDEKPEFLKHPNNFLRNKTESSKLELKPEPKQDFYFLKDKLGWKLDLEPYSKFHICVEPQLEPKPL